MSAVVHDTALASERPFVEAVAAYAVIGEENHRIAKKLADQPTTAVLFSGRDAFGARSSLGRRDGARRRHGRRV